jgi:hypothetical protein
MQNLDDFDIVKTYGAEHRGIAQYSMLETPTLKTLAAKVPVLGGQDGGQVKGQDRNTPRAAHLL